VFSCVGSSSYNQFLNVTSSDSEKSGKIMLCDEEWLNKYFRDSLEGLGEETVSHMFNRTMLII